MRARAFSAVELVVVIVVITIGGSLAVMAMSDQVSTARARSDELGLVMRLKTERNAARERLHPLGISKGAEGSVRFHDVTITRSEDAEARTCTLGDVIRTAHFSDATIATEAAAPAHFSLAGVVSGGAGPLCIDENGRPVGDFNLKIEASDGRKTDVTLTKMGLLKSKLLDGVDIDVANVSEAQVFVGEVAADVPVAD